MPGSNRIRIAEESKPRKEAMGIRWTSDRLDQLENAARKGLKVALRRRGTEYVVVALRLGTERRRDALIARLPMTGEELVFVLDDLEGFQVIP